jgi:hypothetical protein
LIDKGVRGVSAVIDDVVEAFEDQPAVEFLGAWRMRMSETFVKVLAPCKPA